MGDVSEGAPEPERRMLSKSVVAEASSAKLPSTLTGACRLPKRYLPSSNWAEAMQVWAVLNTAVTAWSWSCTDTISSQTNAKMSDASRGDKSAGRFVSLSEFRGGLPAACSGWAGFSSCSAAVANEGAMRFGGTTAMGPTEASGFIREPLEGNCRLASDILCMN